FTATATTAIYPLSLHDALPISVAADRRRTLRHHLRRRAEEHRSGRARHRDRSRGPDRARAQADAWRLRLQDHGRVRLDVEYAAEDRKSTRLNSSHVKISYAVFC